MSEVDTSVPSSLLESPKARRGKCRSCGCSMELYELDFRRSTKVMRCTRCGMLHIYKKDILGKWRLLKAQKPDTMSR